MNLKEAFRFQNRLQELMQEAMAILSDEDNTTTLTKTYLRKKAAPEAENETTVDEHPSEYADRINDVAAFLMYLLNQRELLSAAITKAKAALPMDMDGAVSINGKRQEAAKLFRRMADIRSKEVTVQGGGTGFRFNAEGNQVTYRCDVKKVTTINFDRNKIRAYANRLSRQADQVSTEIDRCLINSEVPYEPPFDVNDSFGVVFETVQTAG